MTKLSLCEKYFSHMEDFVQYPKMTHKSSSASLWSLDFCFVIYGIITRKSIITHFGGGDDPIPRLVSGGSAL